MNAGRCYQVVSVEEAEVVHLLDDGSGPLDYGCDFTYAYARTATRAKVLALRVFRRQFGGKFPTRNYLSRDVNPFVGMEAFPVERHVIDGDENWMTREEWETNATEVA